MTSLSEVYHGEGRAGPSLRRLTFGLGLFLVGALLVIAGIVVASTDVLIGAGTTLGDVRELGGILGGVGVPAVFLGVFAVLPSGRLTKAAAVVGAAISLVGVVLFSHAYPCQWSGATCGQGLTELTLPTVAVYFLGIITTFWCLFVGVANFKTRNDPGGTATVEVTKKGETRYVEVERSRGGLGGIGFLGGQPDGDVDTQTAAKSAANSTANSTGSSPPTPTASMSDGGTDAEALSSPMDSASGGRPQSTPTDTYCGNCDHFEYVRTDEGIQPYCGRHDELMDDMDACDEWMPR